MPADPADRAGAILEIDLAAIAANWRALAKRVAPADCAAVVKADGYGLGAAPVARTLMAAGCRLFFVATIDEGIALRAALGPGAEIAVLNGVLPGCATDFAAARLTPVLNDRGQIAEWAATGGGLPAILHVDTGMTRLGLPPHAAATVSREFPGVQWRAVISHLACADTPEHSLNDAQLTVFNTARANFADVPASLAASSGIFLGRDFHFDFVRPGAALYGVNPLPSAANPLRPVVRLKGRILQVQEVDRGRSVGYGATHVMDASGRLATVAIGYADGWLRTFGRRGGGWIGGRRVPLVGRVSMDLTVFNVTRVDPVLARPGAFIELLNEIHGVDAAAAEAGTIGYEILTSLGRRYHRIYRDAAP
jgi:alanine racemase